MRTIAFFINIPESDRKPSRAVNVKGRPVNSNPRTMPVTDIGTTSHRISGWRTLLNIKIEIVNMTRKPRGSCLPSDS